MIALYPHTAEVVFDIASDTPKVYALNGRLEISGVTNMDYKAKFYAPNSNRLNSMENEQGTVSLHGRRWDIERIVRFATHVELWLK